MSNLFKAVLFFVVGSTGISLGAKELGISMSKSSFKTKGGAAKTVPSEMNYQGWLGYSSDTTAVSGQFNMVFRIYNANSGGTKLWEESQDNVVVNKGVFNVILGSTVSIPSNIFTGVSLWLETQVGSEILLPRKKLTSVGYAIKSQSSDNAVIADTANYVAGANVVGEVANSNKSDTTNYVTGANVSGKVASSSRADTATYALGANVNYVDSARISTNSYKWSNNNWGIDYPKADKSDTALYISGVNVSGKVAQANHSDTANYAISANVQYVDSARVSANSYNWSGNVWGTEVPKANISDTANYVAGASVIGEVTVANYSDTAGYAITAGGVADTANYARNSGKLNSQDASYYLNVSNMNTGTLADTLLSSNVSLLGQTIESSEVADSTIGRNDMVPGFKAPYADTADYAKAVSVQYVDSARVSANSYNWSGNVWGTEVPKANISDTANYVAGANVSGEVAQSNYADTATYALNTNMVKVDSAIYADTAKYAPPDSNWIRNGSILYYSDLSGKVSIGTTTPGTAKLTVWNGNISVSNGGVYSNTGYWGDVLRSNWGNDLSLVSSYSNRGILFSTKFNASTGERVRIDSTGNVGIGTTTPAEKLDVAGTAQVTGFKMPTGANNGYVLTSDSSGAGTWQLTSGDNDWTRNGNQVYTFNATDSVGIGTTTPSTKLDVSGTGSFSTSVQAPLVQPLAGSGNSITVQANDASSGAGGSVTIRSGLGAVGNYAGKIDIIAAPITAGVGQSVNIVGSDNSGGGGNNAGTVNIRGGNAAVANGGVVTITGGSSGGGSSASAGQVTITGGAHVGSSPQSCAGANVVVAGGAQTVVTGTGVGGSVILQGGVSSGSGAHGSILMETGATSSVRMMVDQNGNVGIGTTTPAQGLDVADTVQMIGFKMTTGASNGYVLTSDTSGVGTWQTSAADNDWVISGNRLYPTSNYGIFMRSSNVAYGTNDSTHVNFGVNCTTGFSGQNYRYCTVSGGVNNRATNNNATVGGGYNNIASGERATISGGLNNSAGGYMANVGGGCQNTASSFQSVVAGGNNNTSGHNCTTVGGGYNNIASNPYATVAGGMSNRARGQYSVVCGGGGSTVADSNSAVGEHSAIGGGYRNIASGNSAVISGGYTNSTSNDYATAGGGFQNTASGYVSTIGGGSTNTANGYIATIGGGSENIASGQVATVGGGSVNTASNTNATVGGGHYNKARGQYSVVSGGGGANEADSNCAIGDYSVVSGGRGNIVSGYTATVDGGYYNVASGDYSVIPGGYQDSLTENADTSMAFGSNVYVDKANRVIFFDGTSSGGLLINCDHHNITTAADTFPLRVGTDGSNGNGAYLTKGGVWTDVSSRERKEGFEQLNGDEVLSKVSELSVCKWRYKNTNEYHIGPVAEDFYQAFGVSEEKHLSSMDASGVALRAIQELAAKVESQEKEIEFLKKKLAETEKLSAN